jgi:dynein heavy chain
MDELASSFAALQFDIFVESSLHHWENHLGWFRREVRFLEVSSFGIMDEIFGDLVSARSALSYVTQMLSTSHNEVIGGAVLANVSRVVKQFHTEIERSAATFNQEKAKPPIADDLPPISGAIYWASGIVGELEETLRSMEELKEAKVSDFWKRTKALYDRFRQELKDYQQNQYQEWCCRVSDILAQNLTRPLLLTSLGDDSIRRYDVNFTADLSHALAEVNHLENLGFTVPEVARNMSKQKARLTGIAEELEVMVRDYHASMDSLEIPEVELMKWDTALVHQALRAGHTRLTWNNLSIQESCLQIGRLSICVFKSKIQQVRLIKSELVQAVATIKAGCLMR